ncbi:hypothetical protein [Bacillus marasmi]|uniref:hypothetical protein n=1 Tax=Bacillus marasmi TaxID=1926279 RepID=UPI0011CAA0EB|nr:hypothetical protein [Bacillus marasmi]
MISQDLEFRGINLSDLKLYFEELGGVREPVEGAEAFPVVFVGDDWSGMILSETELVFTPVFKVNAIKVRFVAENEAVLTDLIKKYRLKTTRVGG